MEARLSIDFSTKGSIVSLGKSSSKRKWQLMQLDTISSLDRRSTSRNMQVAAVNGLPSVSSNEKMFIVLQRKRASTCADVMDGSDVASLFSLQEYQILQGQVKGHVILKYMVTYKVSTWKHKSNVTAVWSILEIYLLCIYSRQPRTDC